MKYIITESQFDTLVYDEDKSNAILKVVKYFLNETNLFIDADVEKLKGISDVYGIVLYIDKKTAINLGAGYGPSRNNYITNLKTYLNLIFPDLLYKFWDIDKKDRDKIQL